MSQEQFQSLVEMASKAGLHIEGGDILFSEDQGTPASKALVCVDRWLSFRDDAIRMQVRVLARNSADSMFGWECISEGDFSDPLTIEQASGLVSHWANLSRELVNRNVRHQSEENARVEVFGAMRPRG